MTKFFISDMHFGHIEIINFARRPFTSLDEMTELMVERWNAVVTNHDVVYIGGDACMGIREQSLPILGRCHGRKILVPGNHDHVWVGNGDVVVSKWWDRYWDLAELTDIHTEGYLELKVAGYDVVLNHFPMVGDSHNDERYLEYRPTLTELNRRPLLHGHTHWRHQLSAGGRQIHIGCDAWGWRPVSEDELEPYIRLSHEIQLELPVSGQVHAQR